MWVVYAYLLYVCGVSMTARELMLQLGLLDSECLVRLECDGEVLELKGIRRIHNASRTRTVVVVLTSVKDVCTALHKVDKRGYRDYG